MKKSNVKKSMMEDSDDDAFGLLLDYSPPAPPNNNNINNNINNHAWIDPKPLKASNRAAKEDERKKKEEKAKTAMQRLNKRRIVAEKKIVKAKREEKKKEKEKEKERKRTKRTTTTHTVTRTQEVISISDDDDEKENEPMSPQTYTPSSPSYSPLSPQNEPWGNLSPQREEPVETRSKYDSSLFSNGDEDEDLKLAMWISSILPLPQGLKCFENKECLICTTECDLKSQVFASCGHSFCCKTCLQDPNMLEPLMDMKDKGCPTCRGKVRNLYQKA